jgi:hypothetical protein
LKVFSYKTVSLPWLIRGISKEEYIVESMDVKSWSLIISLLAFTLSLVTFIKTQVWRTTKFNCRMLAFRSRTKGYEKFNENKFFISSSGNQNIYVDKLYINEGGSRVITGSSASINVNKLLKPGEIEEFVCTTDTAIFSHDTTYSFIFTLISADTNQFHCSLKMTTSEQVGDNIEVSPKIMGSGNFSLHTFSFWRNNKVRQSKAQRMAN